VTTATIATTPLSVHQWIRSAIRETTTNPSYRFPIFETSVTALRGTTGNLKVKLPTIWTDEKQRWEKSEKRREEKKKEDQKRESLRRKNFQVREKVRKSRNTAFFQ